MIHGGKVGLPETVMTVPERAVCEKRENNEGLCVMNAELLDYSISHRSFFVSSCDGDGRK